MQSFEFATANRIVFGRGVVSKQLGAIVLELGGKRVLVVTGRDK
jgi:alcohol dehydrogenase YqhD (iron-dependent ADH family)